MKVVATSDIHGTLPEIPECDLLVIAGDVCPLKFDRDLPRSRAWLKQKFMSYLQNAPAKHVVWVAGNHDFVLEHYPWVTNELRDRGKLTNIHYLQDEGIELEGISIYGMPWTPALPGWAFQADGEKTESIYAAIPKHLDLLVTHGPPYGYSDRVSWAGHAGSSELLRACKCKEPRRVITGHIHEGFGTYPTTWSGHLYNVALNNEVYEPINLPIEMEIE